MPSNTPAPKKSDSSRRWPEADACANSRLPVVSISQMSKANTGIIKISPIQRKPAGQRVVLSGCAFLAV